MLSQRLVDLTETLVISGNGDVKQIVAVPEFAARNRFYAVFFTFKYKINNAGSVVDVGQRHCGNMHTTSMLHQILDGDRAETQTVI